MAGLSGDGFACGPRGVTSRVATLRQRQQGIAMSEDRNRWVMTTYVHQVIGEARTDLLEELANQDMVDNAVVAAGGPTGIEGLRLHVNAAIAVMSDRSTTITRIVASDDEVVAWWTVSGVHAAPFLGVDATGRRFTAKALSGR